MLKNIQQCTNEEQSRRLINLELKKVNKIRITLPYSS